MAVNSIGQGPIKPIQGLKTIESPTNSTKGEFMSLLDGLLNNVETTEAKVNENAYKLSIGEMDDLHTMMIDSAKAEIALQTMVQLRNKVLDAYNEIMRINL